MRKADYLAAGKVVLGENIADHYVVLSPNMDQADQAS